jgi:hypothetical protein
MFHVELLLCIRLVQFCRISHLQWEVLWFYGSKPMNIGAIMSLMTTITELILGFLKPLWFFGNIGFRQAVTGVGQSC